MADAVSEGLCEATEYLSKLGSNLRVRTESLKDKRIRKDKLKNAHAAKIAASKVLNICDLSKKAIENVEIRVKKILSGLSASQTSEVGGKIKKHKSEYFIYKSRKLRIRNKINLKHYMSVNVHTTALPKDLQEKYPVYYDCKLYRMRKRKDKNKLQDKNIEVDPDSINDNRVDDANQMSGTFSHVEDNEEEISNYKDTSLPNSPVSNNCQDDVCVESEQHTVPIIEEDTTKPKDLQKNDCKSLSQTEDTELKKKDIQNDENISDTLLDDVMKCRKEIEVERGHKKSVTKNKSKIKKKKYKNIKVFDDSSESDTNMDKDARSDMSITDTDKLNLSVKKQAGENSSNTKNNELVETNKEVVSEIDQNKELTVGTSTKKCNEDENNQKDDDEKENKSGNELDTEVVNPNKKRKLSYDKTDSNDNSNNENSQKQDRDIIEENQEGQKVCQNEDKTNDSIDRSSKETAEFKPLIKCVDINRLLDKKTNINKSLIEISDSDDEDKHKQKESRSLKNKNKNRSSKELCNKKEKLDTNRKSKTDEEHWIQKRKEVKNFTPKNFDIRITRMPKLSAKYLVDQHLKKVTQNGIIVCDSHSKSFNNSITSHAKESESKENDMNAVKNALLNSSDSDKSDSEIMAKTRQAIDKFLNNPETDNFINDNINNKSNINMNLSGKDTDKSDTNDTNCIDKQRTPEPAKKKCKSDVEAEIVKSNTDKSDNNDTNRIDEQRTPEPAKEKCKSDLEAEIVKSNTDKSDTNDTNLIEEQRTPEPAKEKCESDVEAEIVKSNTDKSDTNDTNLIEEQRTPEPAKEKCESDVEAEIVKSNTDKSDTNDTNLIEEQRTPEPAKEKCESDVEAEIVKSNTDKSDTNDTNLIEEQRTPEPAKEKCESDVEAEIVKSNTDKSDENLEKSDSKRRRKSDSTTPSKRKHIMESMHAKKMLLTYSSSSDTEDEQLKNAIKEIRNSLLQETIDELKESDEKKDKSNSESEIQKEKKTKKQKKSKTKVNNQSDTSANDSNRQVEGSTEENSNSSSKKMSEAKSNGNSSSNINSDIEDPIDKDIDGLTNLRTLNKRRRRRRSTSTEESNTHKTRSKMPKAPLLSEECILKAESSSDEASIADSDAAEELPTTLPGLNGDSIGLLAKDDLLGESDSSSTQNDKDTSLQDTQNNESSDENVTSKRRKANALSSDSESGTTRKKNRAVRGSDFEDSEDDNSDPVKKSKRKKKGSDSDASASSSIDGSKKKRRRIKNIDDSEASGSESENEGKNKHGRKNIRKVMGKNQLEEATKKAARQEKERIARIAERQKLYNNLEFDETGKPDEVVLDKVILDFDPETKEPLIEVDKGLVKKLKPHQANGIKFMWDACFESVKRIKKDKGSGCILAHCMGLGKTLQVVSLTHTLLTHSSLTGVRRVLVVCPLSTVLNWVNEFRMWLKHTHGDFEVDVYELSRYKQNSERAYQLQQWFQGGGVCVLGYEMFRNLSADNVKKFKKKMLRNFQESLVDPGPDLVVCDEGHLLKNEKTSLSQAMNRICSLRRIVLTGTPLQNNLKEYYCMVQFVKPNLLGKYNEYLNRFVNPITNGQYTDSTEHDIRIMKRRSHVLHKMLDGAVQRRDYGVLAPFLPPKHEYVLFITLTDVQVKLYQEYLDNYSRRPLPGKSSGFLFPDFQSLQRIWTHPLVLKYNSERYEIMQQKKREREEEDSEGSLVDFIDDDSSPEDTTSEDSTDDSSDMSDDSRKKSKKKKSSKKSKAKEGKEGKAGARRATRANPVEMEEEERLSDVVEVKYENPTEWWIKLVGEDELEDLRHSHKLVLLFDILRQCETIGDKLLVFSQSLYSLDLIEHFLGKVDEATQEARVDEKLNKHVGSWSPGVDYFRLDGSTSCENRSIWCKNFNREDNPRARLFLISTRAGGLGINLVAANRVVIFDVSWNPSHDVQSIFRVYRFGQKKPCYVYRFLAMGTMEEKIYERQVTKQAISKRVIDEQQIDRHYAENDLAELYKFEPSPPSPRELPPLPKDRLFAEMLREHEAQIYKYHEHDSLLENKEEETLTEEERKAAWEDFENEKTRPPPTPFAGAYGMHNGMVPGLLAQQQQLAYAALSAMLRKDMPNINDNQIRDMLPLIYQANPQLMQKMSEIYKYSQPSMMNPGMMNPMNSAGGGAMSMGGSSGLQYEPPWQRQQQQQQQMRLQQLLQQQQNVSHASANDMGAKFYAGGLGSRDPVAMALQQQRAREMMLGERQRPRGRPPARTTPQALGDVVDLDSD